MDSNLNHSITNQKDWGYTGIVQASKGDSALQHLTEYSQIRQHDFTKEDFNYLIQLINADLTFIQVTQFTNYFERLFAQIPSNILAEFLDILISSDLNAEIKQSIAFWLMNSDRPVYQIKGLNLISILKDPTFVPFIINNIYSNHKPLQQKAIETVLTLKGNSESILEQHINDRSSQKKEIAIKVLERLAPANLKLCFAIIKSPDFLERIKAIQILEKSGDRKWIVKIEPLLTDTDLSVRKAAIEAIAQLGGRRAKQTLLKRLHQEEYNPLKILIENYLLNQ